MSLDVSTNTTEARDALHAEYRDCLEENPHLDRALVSFQANKRQPFYGWFKYKEGFSPQLVEYCLAGLRRPPGTLLDPFAGAGAALFASQDQGWNSLGIEVLPVCQFAIQARLDGRRVAPEKFAEEASRIEKLNLRDLSHEDSAFRHISITEGAFPPDTEAEMAGYMRHCRSSVRSPAIRRLLEFACMCVLEEVSFTRKDGQYLRWDSRSPKKTTGRPFDKGPIPPFRDAIRAKLRQMKDDLFRARYWLAPHRGNGRRKTTLELRQGSCLEVLPTLAERSVDVVFTSPPYCNRYDYTRTYALELAFLGFSDSQVRSLRQQLLSSTVENRAKCEELRKTYEQAGASDRFDAVSDMFAGQQALREVLEILDHYRQAGQLNNPNIARMVRNYFYEMALVIAELARVLVPGGAVVMVNDNVRYAGQTVPVDLILSDFAARMGLHVERIWTLPTGKGNSSQQMGAHGRKELRKCVYFWTKPG